MNEKKKAVLGIQGKRDLYAGMRCFTKKTRPRKLRVKVSKGRRSTDEGPSSLGKKKKKLGGEIGRSPGSRGKSERE